MKDWFARGRIAPAPAFDDAPENPLAALSREPPAPPWPVAMLRHSIHQFHSGSAEGDAITNAMLLCRDLLRRQGYRSEIFVEYIDPALIHVPAVYVTFRVRWR